MRAILILLCCVFSFSSYSSIVPKGHYILRQSISVTKSKELWIGNGDKVEFNGGTQQFIEGETSGLIGIMHNLQLNLAISYFESKMAGNAFQDAKKDQTLSSINRVNLGITTSLHKGKNTFNLDGFINYSVPGRNNPEVPVFIHPNDFSKDLTIGIQDSFSFTDWSISNSIAYVIRDPENANQIKADIYINKKNINTFSYGFGLGWVDTFGGYDIGAPDFVAKSNDLGVTALHLKRERSLSGSIIFSKVLSKKLWLDLYFSKKISGENTNNGYTAGMGINKFF